MSEPEIPGVGFILLRRWWVVAVGLMLGVVLGFVALQVLPATYSATSTLLIKGVPGTGSGANFSAAQYAVARAGSYPSFISSTVVLGGIRSDLDDGSDDREIRDALAATNPTDTPLVHLAARGATAEQAQARANSAARHMARFISQIESVGGVSPVLVEIAVQADLPGEPSNPQPLLVLGVGAATGLAFGAVAAVLMNQVARRRTRDHPPSRQRDPVIAE